MNIMKNIYDLIKDSPYFSMSEHSPLPVLWMRSDGTFFHANPEACSFFGFTNDEFRYMKVYDIDPYFRIEDTDVMFEQLKNKKMMRHTTQLYIRNGTCRDVEVIANYIEVQGYEFICTYLFDMTERLLKDKELTIKTIELETVNEHLEKIIEERTAVLNHKVHELEEAQKMLKYSEEKFSKAFETSKDAININRFSDGVYIDINDGFTQALGYTRDDVIGKSSIKLNIWKNVSDREKLVAGLQKYGTVHDLEAEYVHKDGRMRFGLMSASIHEIKGEKVIISVTRDITRQKEMEIELLRLNAELGKRVEKEVSLRQKQENILFEQRKFADMGQMINAIAHQWRQPLNALGLMIQDITDAYEAEELTKNYLCEFEKKSFNLVAYMSDTIDQFRNFFKTSKEKEDFDLLETISEVFSLISAQLTMKKITYAVSCEKDGVKEKFSEFRQHRSCTKCSPTIRGYSGEFKQALLNMIYNSVDAIEEQASLDKNFKGYISVEILNDDNTFSIVITDNGGGIPEKVLPKIFDPFFTTKGENKGTGIGLYMSRLIFEKHFSGHISAENTDTGARFCVRLPYR